MWALRKRKGRRGQRKGKGLEGNVFLNCYRERKYIFNSNYIPVFFLFVINATSGLIYY
jgi:hypothetical protein